jgi:hypothetical protein
MYWSSCKYQLPHLFLNGNLSRRLSNKLQQFLLELVKGISFVSRQFRISTETSEFYIDLVFYYFILKCFVLIDLKPGRLAHQGIGQMDMYVRLFEDRVKTKRRQSVNWHHSLHREG